MSYMSASINKEKILDKVPNLFMVKVREAMDVGSIPQHDKYSAFYKLSVSIILKNSGFSY